MACNNSCCSFFSSVSTLGSISSVVFISFTSSLVASCELVTSSTLTTGTESDWKKVSLSPVNVPVPSCVFTLSATWLLISSFLPGNSGANILVDNKGCIKLADFGAPEVILQTGHSFSADIWTNNINKRSQLYFILALQSLIHLSPIIFLLRHKIYFSNAYTKPEMRPSASASGLLQHPFVTGKSQQNSLVATPTMENIEPTSTSSSSILDNSGLGSCLKLYNLVASPFGSFLIRPPLFHKVKVKVKVPDNISMARNNSPLGNQISTSESHNNNDNCS
ncbi:hypothetical protein L1887_29976 [Cichorium endivia]|nr:hypothetical protein L1887_29976 [Cichorium endivia]